MNAPAKITAEPSAGKYKLRVEDYLLLDEGGSFGDAQTELVDGDVIVMSPEWVPHMRIKDELAFLLRVAIEKLGLDLRVGTGGSVQLSDVDQPRPDVIVMHPTESTTAVPQDAVLILVEVAASTVSFDFEDKAALYARSDVPEYWGVDVNGRMIHRWSSPSAEGYKAHREVRFGKPLTATTIDGLTIDTSSL